MFEYVWIAASRNWEAHSQGPWTPITFPSLVLPPVPIASASVPDRNAWTQTSPPGATRDPQFIQTQISWTIHPKHQFSHVPPCQIATCGLWCVGIWEHLGVCRSHIHKDSQPMSAMNWLLARRKGNRKFWHLRMEPEAFCTNFSLIMFIHQFDVCICLCIISILILSYIIYHHISPHFVVCHESHSRQK